MKNSTPDIMPNKIKAIFLSFRRFLSLACPALFFFKQKTAYELGHVTGVQTCALPILVTANKALLAQDGAALYEAADTHGVDLYFEAAVAGAIPLVRPVRESLAGDRIQRVLGIVNGTTNYILDAMTRSGAGFDDALATAQELGY